MLADCTRELTHTSMATCEALRWRASYRGHKLELLPISRSEYLTTLLIVGSNGEFAASPYEFSKWWLEHNTGPFELV